MARYTISLPGRALQMGLGGQRRRFFLTNRDVVAAAATLALAVAGLVIGAMMIYKMHQGADNAFETSIYAVL